MRARSMLVATLALIAGCGACAGAASEEPARGSRPAEARGSADPRSEREPPADPGSPPTVRVVGLVDRHARRVAIRVESRGEEPTSVARELAVQRREGSGWVETSRLELRFDCDTRPPQCVTLAPGAVLLPPPWLAMRGDAQCACDRCARAPPGSYRFVARGCAGEHAVESEPFELPP